MSCRFNYNIYKKRKLNDTNIILHYNDKEKLINYINNYNTNNSNNKRKFQLIIKENSKKIKKNNYCSIHENKNICDMYECSGGFHITNNNNFMPYIV